MQVSEEVRVELARIGVIARGHREARTRVAPDHFVIDVAERQSEHRLSELGSPSRTAMCRSSSAM
jgi:hypothetical protein